MTSDSNLDSNKIMNQTAPTFNFGGDMSRQTSTASAPGDYFATPSSAASNASESPWKNLLQNDSAAATPSFQFQAPQMPSIRSSLQHTSAAPPPSILPNLPRTVYKMKSGGSAPSGLTFTSAMTAEEVAKFGAVEVNEFAEFVTTAPQENLIIDIRPSTSFSLARIKDSINVCAPSTLLRRAGVTIERIEEEMLNSEQDRLRFAKWRKRKAQDSLECASDSSIDSDDDHIERIIVLDIDTQNLSDTGKSASGGGGPCLLGMMRKFDQAGFEGRLCWLKGGFNAVASREKESSTLIDRGAMKAADSSTLSQKNKLSRSDSAMRRSSAPNFKMNGLSFPPLKSPIRQGSLVQPKGLPMEAFSSSSTTAKGRSTAGTPNVGAAANPFFDNIRQNKELQNGITEKIPLDIPEITESEIDRLPPFLIKLAKMNTEERANSLAQSFFEVEQQERDRLMATMQQHVEESDCKGGKLDIGLDNPNNPLQLSSLYNAVSPGQDGHAARQPQFPFSISAALERGGENRYNNIWTYEHSRVRCPQSADYLNGSYIEPAREFGCKRRYIATQAPLPSTFSTFWSVIWQQNVRTICMVTREFESGRVQSHNYWSDTAYGDLSLELIEEVALDEQGNATQALANKSRPSEPNYFNLSQPGQDQDYSTIKRTFWLKRNDGKEEKRLITQLQYIAWPDYSVPSEAEGLLVLLKLANTAQHKIERSLQNIQGQTVGPMVIHCSAGVGRTGTYIVIDAVLDVIRRARWAKTSRISLDTWEPGMTTKQSDRGRERLLPRPPQLQQDVLMKRAPKRELSPSAMKVDAAKESAIDFVGVAPRGSKSSTSSTTSTRDMNSPPPTRRTKSDGVEDLKMQPFAFSKFSNAPDDGPKTPSTALSELTLSSAGNGNGTNRHQTPPSSRFRNRTQSEKGGKDAEDEQLATDFDGIDLVRKTLDTIREQRMSMVQTTRQFVFAYRTVFTGVLNELQHESNEFVL